MQAISVQHLTKRFGLHMDGFLAVSGVTMTVNTGDIYALIGPNGAGKTTLLKMLVGLITPTSGTATLFGHNIIKTPVAAKRQFGYIPDDPSAYEYLSGLEFLTLSGRLRGLTDVEIPSRINGLLPLFPVSDIIGQPMSQYSRGNKQKVTFLACLLSEPRILIIDEPIVGMDPASTEIMGNVLREYAAKGNTVLIVTHSLEFAHEYATRVGIMKEGKLIHETKMTKSIRLETFLK